MSGKATKRPKVNRSIIPSSSRWGQEIATPRSSRLAMTRIMIAVLCLIPAVGYGEPGVGMGHIPVLWGILLITAGGLALIPALLKKFGGVTMSRKMFWLFTLLPPLLFLLFVGPVFVVLGSILITGRTM